MISMFYGCIGRKKQVANENFMSMSNIMNTEDSRDIIKLTDCFKALSIDMQTNLTITMISGKLL